MKAANGKFKMPKSTTVLSTLWLNADDDDDNDQRKGKNEIKHIHKEGKKR